jgi:hypothetical protein
MPIEALSMGVSKAQGATEYLVLLAVVLIVALVSVALLGFFPGMASDSKISQSESYWKSASPFAIIEDSISAGNTTVNASGTFTLMNMKADGQYTITSLNVSSCTPNTTSTSFAPGEVKKMSFGGCGVTFTVGTTYDWSVNITYTTPNGVSGKQYGGKNVVGKFI